MAKTPKGKPEKAGLLQQDLNLDTIKGMFKKKPKTAEEIILNNNSNVPFVAGIPEVNILPTRVKEVYAAEDLRKKFMIAGSGLMIGFAALWGVSLVTEGINQGKVDDIQETTAAYQVETTQMTPYMAYRTQIEAKRAEIAGQMTTHLNVAGINSNFTSAAEAAGYDVSGLTLTISSADAAGGAVGSCVNPDPFNPATGIGCLNFTLSGDGSLTELYSVLNEETVGFVNPYVPSAVGGTEEGTIDGSVSVESSYYTGKYEGLNLPLDSINQAAPVEEAAAPEEAAPAEEGQ